MTIVSVDVDGIPTNLYVDERLLNAIETKIKKRIQRKDQDLVWIIDGKERSGKSTFAIQLAKILDPKFNLSKICMTPEEFTKAVIKAKKGDCVIYDEAFTGLSSRGSLTEINRMLVSLMMEMGQKNLYILIVLPTFFMIDRYVALFRAHGLFHVYEKQGKRGFWTFFNDKKKNFLYLTGKKYFSYNKPKSRTMGRFTSQYAVNEEDYRDKKRKTLNKKSRLTKYQVIMGQRNALICLLYTKFNLNQSQISDLFKEVGYTLARNTISEIITDFKNALKESAEEEVAA